MTDAEFIAFIEKRLEEDRQLGWPPTLNRDEAVRLLDMARAATEQAAGSGE